MNKQSQDLGWACGIWMIFSVLLLLLAGFLELLELLELLVLLLVDQIESGLAE